MKIISLILFIGISSTTAVLDGSVFKTQSLNLYTADYDVIGVYVIPNSDKTDGKIYTIQYDTKNDEEKGIFESSVNDNTTVKILDTGKDLCYDNDTTIFVASKDGIYVYKTEDKSFNKYGAFKDDIISITKLNGSDIFYVVTKENKVYKITDNGNKFVVNEKLKNVKQVVFDNTGVLYYVTKDNEVFKVDGGIHKIRFNVKISNAVLLKPEADTNTIPVIINDDVFSISSEGTSKIIDNLGRVSALSMETGSLVVYAVDKKVNSFIPLLYVLNSLSNNLASVGI